MQQTAKPTPPGVGLPLGLVSSAFILQPGLLSPGSGPPQPLCRRYAGESRARLLRLSLCQRLLREANSPGKHTAQPHAFNYWALEWQCIRKPCCFCTADAGLGLAWLFVCFSSGTAWDKGIWGGRGTVGGKVLESSITPVHFTHWLREGVLI